MKQQSRIWATTTTQKRLNELKSSDGSFVSAHVCTYEPTLITYDSTQDAIWYSYYLPDTYELAKVSVITGDTVSTLNIGIQIDGLVYDSYNNLIWASTRANGKLYKVNAATGALINSYTVGYYIRDISYDITNNIVWCLGNDRIAKFDVATDGVTTIGNYGSAPQKILFDVNNNAVWVSSIGYHQSLYKYDVVTGNLLNTLATESSSSGTSICIDTDLDAIWITKNSTTVRCFSTVNGDLIDDYTVPSALHTDLKYDETTQSIWVLNEYSVSKLDSTDGTVIGTYDINATYVSQRLAISTFKNIDITGTVYTNSTKSTTYADGLSLSLEINDIPRLVDKYGEFFAVTTTNGEFAFNSIDNIEVGDTVKVVFDDTQYNAEIEEEIDDSESNTVELELYPVMTVSSITPNYITKGTSLTTELVIAGNNFGDTEGTLTVGSEDVIVDEWTTNSITFSDQEAILPGRHDIVITTDDLGTLTKSNYLSVKGLKDTHIDFTFVNNTITDESELFPDTFGITDITAVTNVIIKMCLQRFRYRGKRESAKWNTFLRAFDIDYNNLSSNLVRIKSAFERKYENSVAINTLVCCIAMANKQAIDYLKRGM